MSELDLTSADRCDQCQAQAWVRAWIDTAKSDLLFCGHHWHVHKAKFVAADWLWVDNTDRINATLDVSA
jgi:hypothetical protein